MASLPYTPPPPARCWVATWRAVVHHALSCAPRTDLQCRACYVPLPSSGTSTHTPTHVEQARWHMHAHACARTRQLAGVCTRMCAWGHKGAAATPYDGGSVATRGGLKPLPPCARHALCGSTSTVTRPSSALPYPAWPSETSSRGPTCGITYACTHAHTRTHARTHHV